VGVIRIAVALIVVGLSLALPPRSSAEVRVTIENGLVTIAANGATVREILAEWARVGQTRIVNAERVTGAPVTMQLTDVPEARALDIVLRSVSGYLAAPRAEANPALSRFDRILVLPTSTPPRNPPPASAPPTFQPASPQPSLPGPADAEPDDGNREPPAGFPARPGGVFNPFPQTGVSPNDPPPPPAQPAPPPSGVFGATPGGKPVGVSVPGMVAPAPTPQQPGVPPDQR